MVLPVAGQDIGLAGIREAFSVTGRWSSVVGRRPTPKRKRVVWWDSILTPQWIKNGNITGSGSRWVCPTTKDQGPRTNDSFYARDKRDDPWLVSLLDSRERQEACGWHEAK